MFDAAPSAHVLKISGNEDGAMAKTVTVFELTLDDVSEDLHVRVWVSWKSSFLLNRVIVHDSKRFEPHVIGIKVTREREGEASLKPTVISTASFGSYAFRGCGSHDFSHVLIILCFIEYDQCLVFG